MASNIPAAPMTPPRPVTRLELPVLGANSDILAGKGASTGPQTLPPPLPSSSASADTKAAAAPPAPLPSPVPASSQPIAKKQPGGKDGFDDYLEEKAKKYRDHIWRWATIGISCLGGLASGWAGSYISNRASSFFDQIPGLVSGPGASITNKAASLAAIAGKGRKSAQEDKLEANARREGRALKVDRGMSPVGGKAQTSAVMMAGDDQACAVLVLDRAMGLTLVHPCHSSPAANNNAQAAGSTLSLSDLQARPPK